MTAELKQKVTEDRTIKQKKAKNFRGLQPSERPIILPGGRKWKNAKDAMNDELIAEIISSQAELIMGTTLGYVKLIFIYFFIISTFWTHKLTHQHPTNCMPPKYSFFAFISRSSSSSSSSAINMKVQSCTLMTGKLNLSLHHRFHFSENC